MFRFHIHQDSLILNEILELNKKILKQGEKIMAKVDELEAELVEANKTTNEIANDIADLLNRLASGGLTVEEADRVKAQIVALNDRLKGVASQH